MLKLAKEYGQSPEDVENWDPYWFNRALTLLDGEAIADRQEMDAMQKRKK